MFGVTPDIKIISFGVRRLKNRRVTPNGEEIKDEKRNFRIHIHTSDLWIQIRIQEAQKHVDPVDPDPASDPDPHTERNSGRRERP